MRFKKQLQIKIGDEQRDVSGVINQCFLDKIEEIKHKSKHPMFKKLANLLNVHQVYNSWFNILEKVNIRVKSASVQLGQKDIRQISQRKGKNLRVINRL